MMHRNDFVVSVQPVTDDKAYREYKIDGFTDSGDTRVRQINIPFNQEYQFTFKNMKNVRRSVSIEIDGSEIGQWVVNAGTKKRPYIANLERFMDSDKRFKVLGLGDGGVDDPDNPDNGLVKITVIDEHTPQVPSRKSTGGVIKGSRGRSRGRRDITYSADVSVSGASASGSSLYTADSSCLRGFSSNVATGEGSRSNQNFSSTYWNGDHGRPFYFEYRFKGVDRTISKLKWEFCVDCGVKLQKEANFCHACGAESKVMMNC